MTKLLFVDRDGTLLQEPLDKQIDKLEKMSFVDGAILGLKALKDAGWQLILVSNQDGLGTASFPQASFEAPQNAMLQILKSCDIEFHDVLICPHFAEADCLCRKPRTGLLLKYLEQGFDRNLSVVVGDRETDLQLAEALGVQGFRLSSELGWTDVVAALLTQARRAQVTRKTRETELKVKVNLDAYTPPHVRTGSKFFDHMLEQIGQHAGIGLSVDALGDWDVDDHHTIEDAALAIGQAIREALGDKFGITRYGFLLPMDETLAECALDLSGRPHCSYEAVYTRESVGGLATEMIPHFFRSLADGLRASLHLKISGTNNHHIAEAGFKAVGRCLGQAVERKAAARIPSSKGVL